MDAKPIVAKPPKPAPKPASKGKPQPKSEATPETSTTITALEAKPEITPESTTAPTVEPAPESLNTPPLTLERLQEDLQSLRMLVIDHSLLITQLQESLSRKRKAVTSTDKVQIRDKQTGTIYPSKNNTFQSMLKSGQLKELVDKGVFGANPEKNTFGWYALVREWPDRFEEVPTPLNNI